LTCDFNEAEPVNSITWLGILWMGYGKTKTLIMFASKSVNRTFRFEWFEHCSWSRT